MAEDQAELLLRPAREDELAARALLPIEGVADSILGPWRSRSTHDRAHR